MTNDKDDVRVTTNRLRELTETRNVEVKRMALELLLLRDQVTMLTIHLERMQKR